jgi:hypothetical protein
MTTYWIIGSDGRTYGPVDRATMERWIAESRVVATTQVGTSEHGPWNDATLVPGLAAAFGAEPAEAGVAAAGGAGPYADAAGAAPPTAPAPAPVMPADWPPSMVSVPQLVSGILNLIAAAGWLLTCFGVVLTVPLAILGVHELLAYSRARTAKPAAYLESAGRLAVFDVCTLLAGNIGSAICGVVVLTQLSAARERAQVR